MAGDWIRIEHVTPDKPEIMAIAEIIGQTENQVLGGLVRFWIWCDSQSRSGRDIRVTKFGMERITNVTGLFDAMIQVGWLVSDEHGIHVPNYGYHLSQNSKQRALAAKRKSIERSKYVTEMSRCERDKNVTREEKRREENMDNKVFKKDTYISGRKRFAKPTVDEVRAYCQERGNTVDPQVFVDHYESNGWKIGKSPMKDWQAAIRTWEKNQKPSESEKPRVIGDYDMAHGHYNGYTFTKDAKLCRDPNCQPCAEKRSKGLTK